MVADGDPEVHKMFRQLVADEYVVVSFFDSEEALKWLKQNTGIAVVVSSFNLPGRGGVEFHKTCESLAPYTARIMLTKEQSLDLVLRAVNEGHLFMYLTKPCPAPQFLAAVRGAVAHHKQMIHDRALLERTLAGSVKMLIEVLTLFHGDAFRRTGPMRQQALRMARALGLEKTWELQMAVMLSPLGEALLPKDILTRYRAAKSLSEQERDILARAPNQTRDLLKNIPQMERVAEVLYLSNRGYDGSGFPKGGPKGEDIPIAARIIKLLTDLWYASPETGVDAAAFGALRINGHRYDPKLLKLAKELFLEQADSVEGRVAVLCYLRALRVGDILSDDVRTEISHELVLAGGHQLTETTIRRLEQYNRVSGIRQPIRVLRKQPKPVEQDVPA
ncbi:response regulator receiver modulated metal-depenent phosphohydrolase [Roseibium aquae]|uniref:Response regulator receiver modulated metal-depenent phosphohydrolase n=2 Tax=Roseibium aquae TaxID=1323746 RepID=A0A916TLR2_9HYPH|nr:response regulator receiver modulated metal-depenent phosphohydrolase [Roseibium aquae]